MLLRQSDDDGGESDPWPQREAGVDSAKEEQAPVRSVKL